MLSIFFLKRRSSEILLMFLINIDKHTPKFEPSLHFSMWHYFQWMFFSSMFCPPRCFFSQTCGPSCHFPVRNYVLFGVSYFGILSVDFLCCLLFYFDVLSVNTINVCEFTILLCLKPLLEVLTLEIQARIGWIRNFAIRNFAPRIHFVFREIISLFREISRPSFAKFREIKMEIVSEISRN